MSFVSGKSCTESFLPLRPSWQPNWNRCASGTALAPFGFEFFEYFLRQHLRLRFMSGAFASTAGQSLYDTFAHCIAIFSHDDVRGRITSSGHAMSPLLSADLLDGTEILARSDAPSEEDLS
jgi:hypothetical protein